jgi:hypothetical protein
LKALDEMAAGNLGTFALTILEPSDFDKSGQLNRDKVFGQFIEQVGSYALGVEGLKEEFLTNIQGGGSGERRDISLAYNVGYDYSAASAFAFAERESSDTFFVGDIQRKASLLGQGLYKTAPSDFTLTYGGQLLLDTVNTAALATGIYNLGRLGFNAVRTVRAPSGLGQRGVNLLNPKQIQSAPPVVRFGAPRGGGGGPADRAYAYRVTGGAEKAVYVNGTEFDAVRSGILIDAKRASGSGSFYDISVADRFTQNVKIPEIIGQAQRQLDAIRGQGFRGIRWEVSDPNVAQQLQGLFTQRGIRIQVIHTPGG